MNDTTKFLNQAIELARANVDEGGRPFGAVLVRDGQVIAAGEVALYARWAERDSGWQG